MGPVGAGLGRHGPGLGGGKPYPGRMTWMVTGGAGYIGAHIVKALKDSGRGVVAFDDLSTGEARKVPSDVPLVEASVVDAVAVEKAMRENDVTGVVHMAAKKAVGESVERPLYYYRENVDGLLSLLEAMDATGVKKMVYSSSAATFGMPDSDDPLTEDFVCQPINPYGETKLIGEWLMRDVAAAIGLDWISLRYFNVAGAGGPDLGDTGVFNLIPAFPMDGGRVLRAVLSLRMDRVRATRWAATAGQAVAVAFGFAGLSTGNPMLVLIAVFVFVAAGAEAQDVAMRAMARRMMARDGMITEYETLAPDDGIGAAAQALIRTTQAEFPVLYPGGGLAGFVTRAAIFAAHADGKAHRVAEIAETGIPEVAVTAGLEKVLEALAQGTPAVAVMARGGAMAGYVTRENIGELMVLRGR